MLRLRETFLISPASEQLEYVVIVPSQILDLEPSKCLSVPQLFL